MLTFKTLALAALTMSAVSTTRVVARPTSKIELRLQTLNLDSASHSASSTPISEISDPNDLMVKTPHAQLDLSGDQGHEITPVHIEKRLRKRCLTKKSQHHNHHRKKAHHGKKHHKQRHHSSSPHHKKKHHKQTHHSSSHHHKTKHHSSHHHNKQHHHKSHAKFHSGQGTYYDAGLGACGETNSGTDLIAAISHDVYDRFTVDGNPNNNALCNKYVEAKYGSHSVRVKIVDRCVGCAAGDLDFSRSAFARLAPMALGRINIKSRWLTGPLA